MVKVASKWGQLCPSAFQIVFSNFNSFRCKRVRRAWIPISVLWSQKIFRRNAVWIYLIQSDPIAKLADRSWTPSDQTCAWPKKKTGAKLHRIRPQNGLRGSRIPRIPWYNPEAGSKIKRIPQQNNLRFPISVGFHYDLRGKDLGSTGSLMKMPMQYATSTKILDIRSSMSPVSFHTTRKKRHRKPQRSTPSIKNVYLMVEDSPESMNFLWGRSRIPRIQQQLL